MSKEITLGKDKVDATALDRKDVKGKDLLSVTEFITKYHPKLTNNAVCYAMRKGKVDFTRIGRDRLVVLTTKTLSYSPNASKARDNKEIEITKE